MNRFLTLRRRARVYIDATVEDLIRCVEPPPMIQVFIKVCGITQVALVSDNMQPVFEKVRSTFVCSDFFSLGTANC